MLCLGGGECKACVAWPPQWGHLASPCVSRPPQWLQRTSVLLWASNAVRVTSGRAASARFCGCPRGTAVWASCSASTSASRASIPVCSSGSCSGGPPRVCDPRVDGSALGSTAGRVTVWVTSVAAPRSTGRALAAVTPVAARCSTGASSVLAARRRSSDLGERSGSSGRAPRAAQRGIMVPIYGREGKVLR